MKQTQKTLAALVLTTLLFQPLIATAMIVSDPGEYARTMKVYNENKKQVQQAIAQSHTMLSQYKELQDTNHNLTGHYGWGHLMNSQQDLKNKQWSAGRWQDSLKGLSGGNPRRYQELLSQYKTSHPTLESAQVEKGSDGNLAKAYRHQVGANQASSTMASYAFNELNAHLKTVQSLGEQIENAKNKDAKSAMDLNSRIQLEVAYIAIASLRMQTLLNQQKSAAAAHEIALENEGYLYNQAGEK